MVNGDPDMGAIFRLTRKSAMLPLNITFDPTTPPLVLPKGTYSPYNSQNTLFHYNSFWGLYLPTTVHLRVTDIWRSYWVQKVLTLIKGTVGFYSPVMFQDRSPHY